MHRSLISCLTILSLLMLSAACSKEEAKTTNTAEKPLGGACMGPAGLPRTQSPAGARVYFKTPSDGDIVSSPVWIEFGLSGMDVAPSGDDRANSGHHHLIIDRDLPPFTLPVAADENHIHFGDGSTSKELTLAPGQHTLQLLLGDHLHIPHNPPIYSEQIRITVE